MNNLSNREGKAMSPGMSNHHPRTPEQLAEQERRVALLKQAIMRHEGQRRFAAMSRISIHTIRNWLQGQSPISDEHVGAIERYAGGER